MMVPTHTHYNAADKSKLNQYIAWTDACTDACTDGRTTAPEVDDVGSVGRIDSVGGGAVRTIGIRIVLVEKRASTPQEHKHGGGWAKWHDRSSAAVPTAADGCVRGRPAKADGDAVHAFRGAARNTLPSSILCQSS